MNATRVRVTVSFSSAIVDFGLPEKVEMECYDTLEHVIESLLEQNPKFQNLFVNDGNVLKPFFRFSINRLVLPVRTNVKLQKIRCGDQIQIFGALAGG